MVDAIERYQHLHHLTPDQIDRNRSQLLEKLKNGYGFDRVPFVDPEDGKVKVEYLDKMPSNAQLLFPHDGEAYEKVLRAMAEDDPSNSYKYSNVLEAMTGRKFFGSGGIQNEVRDKVAQYRQEYLAAQPKEGDRKTEGGVNYELRGGRWHRVDEPKTVDTVINNLEIGGSNSSDAKVFLRRLIGQKINNNTIDLADLENAIANGSGHVPRSDRDSVKASIIAGLKDVGVSITEGRSYEKARDELNRQRRELVTQAIQAREKDDFETAQKLESQAEELKLKMRNLRNSPQETPKPLSVSDAVDKHNLPTKVSNRLKLMVQSTIDGDQEEDLEEIITYVLTVAGQLQHMRPMDEDRQEAIAKQIISDIKGPSEPEPAQPETPQQSTPAAQPKQIPLTAAEYEQFIGKKRPTTHQRVNIKDPDSGDTYVVDRKVIDGETYEAKRERSGTYWVKIDEPKPVAQPAPQPTAATAPATAPASAVSPAAPQTDPLGMIHNAILHLAENDPDRAGERNEAGFNAFDSEFGHSLANQIKSGKELSKQQYESALKMLGKYTRQVGALPTLEDVSKAFSNTPKQYINVDIKQTRHAKRGIDLHVVTLGDRVARDKYDHLNQKAKSLGGWYSSYSKMGAIPGFQFEQEKQPALPILALAGWG